MVFDYTNGKWYDVVNEKWAGFNFGLDFGFFHEMPSATEEVLRAHVDAGDTVIYDVDEEGAAILAFLDGSRDDGWKRPEYRVYVNQTGVVHELLAPDPEA